MDYNEEIDEFAPASDEIAQSGIPNEQIVQPQQTEPTPDEGTRQEQARDTIVPKAYQTIIDQQAAQINALIAQNESLNGQIYRLIQNGAQITGNSQPGRIDPLSNLNGAALSDGDDWSLESLAKDIGKRSKHA